MTEKANINVGGLVGIGQGLGCAAIIIAVTLCLGGGCVIVDKVFDRLESLERVKQQAEPGNGE